MSAAAHAVIVGPRTCKSDMPIESAKMRQRHMAGNLKNQRIKSVQVLLIPTTVGRAWSNKCTIWRGPSLHNALTSPRKHKSCRSGHLPRVDLRSAPKSLQPTHTIFCLHMAAGKNISDSHNRAAHTHCPPDAL